ncbi:MAG TPA: B-box zinc finger protein [Terriglobales bacterium]|nr:B-box zinc finger protein [Terriglobales bacterium]
MNCANHPDTGATAYCRTCGKALCPQCTRDVRGVIYCENCLAARIEGSAPPSAVYSPITDPGSPHKTSPVPGSGPNPALAGILGAIPFGVGAIYNGQYAKGLAHMLIFVGLIVGASHGGELWGTVFGVAIPFFVFYQIFDAVRSAKAIQMGQPAPDPFGLGQVFSSGERVDVSKTPVAAIVLIGLGTLFLLNTTLDLRLEHIWPVFLVLLGLWLLARRLGYVGSGKTYDCDRCRSGSLMGPAILATVGVIWLLDDLTRFEWQRTCPILLVVIGLVKFLQSNASDAGHQSPPVQSGPAAMTGEIQPPPTEVKHG